MQLTTPTLVALGLSELVALVAIVLLWWRPRKLSVLRRMTWSLVLLVPVLGLVLYGLARPSPKEHPDDPHLWDQAPTPD